MAHRKNLVVACAFFVLSGVSLANAGEIAACPSFEAMWSGALQEEHIAAIREDLVQTIIKTAEDEAPYRLLNVINWKVGDNSDFILSSPSFGKLGKMHKYVSSDEGETLWVTQDIDLSSQKEKIEAQIRKSDGVVIKMLRNGKPQELPKDQPDVREQKNTEVTVPAGKFKAVYLLIDTKDVKGLELWANPKDTVMEGTLKQIAPTSMMTIQIELEKFAHAK